MNISVNKLSLITRLLSLGVFQAKDKDALRLLSEETLEKIMDTVNLPQMPTVRGSFFRPSVFIPDEEVAEHMKRGRS